ncbi:MAG: putative anti-sigma regulatory factor, serine/threonine protein kinase [Gemmatimonadetes bacterium]|jgi:serine/threonine-protein kinase RsbT|nr:putative anti-sigma regulatory factor, serine/threonine protein kinase [Gemmatimonadota bacterium]
MLTTRSETVQIRQTSDIVNVRQVVRSWCLAIGMGLVDLTKIVTAASEIARNTLDYGRGGTMLIEELRDGIRAGVRLTFVDEGPGIPDIARAMTDGYTSGGGMGLGLGGTKRLVDDFTIDSAAGAGTRIAIIKWKSR